ncbi:MAG: 50S ribosomal protein L21e [Nanoarchaeota archaeon]
MVGRKKIKTRGKLQLSRYFQELNEGDKVAVVREPAVQSSFPERMQGRTGVVEGKRGRTYMVKVKDQNKEKRYLIAPVHLKKMEDN